MTPSRKDLDVRGDLQAEIMAAVWKLGEAKVDDVRNGQPLQRRSAYNTVQTVMNRLVDRGLLKRERQGHAYVYTAQYAEGDYLSKAITDRLADASADARKVALANLVGELEPSELDEIARYANRVKRARKKS